MHFLLIRDLYYSTWGNPQIQINNITLQKAEKVALVGQNGSGKSTLLKLIFGELNPDRGNIEVKAKIGYLPQQIDTAHNQTIFEYIPNHTLN